MNEDSSQQQTPAPVSTHPSFEHLRSRSIPSLNLEVQEYRHRKTGARHFHLAAEDSENAFLVAFRTVPMDSTGVAHILEHTVLCGSEKYPVRDPFFMMIRRSLNTFMNALTSSDWTAYPFASQNRKDFYNLLDIYLDAVFFARLHELDFAQEGHRVEFAAPEDPGSPLVYKGVVYNEMKGAMSSPVRTLYTSLTRYLFPTTTYHYNSGGDPDEIPTLSYSELKEFYRSHYHPSNAVFMTYGDLPAQEHQQRMEDQALSRFERHDPHLRIKDEQRYFAPLRVEESYGLDEPGAQGDRTHVVLGWLLGHSADLDELLTAHLLSSVLLDSSASPLRHALETSELGSAPSPLSGVEDSNREMSFMCGLEGSRPEHAQAVEDLVLGVLEEVAREGIAQDRLEAVLHQLELAQREVEGGGYPYGLHLIMRSLSAAIHDGDPVAQLDLDPAIERLREAIADPDFIKRLIRDWLLDNPHRVRLTLKPDPDLEKRRERAQAQALEALRGRLSEADRERIVSRARELAERQTAQDDPDVLPKVGLDDIPADIEIPSARQERMGAFPLTFYGQPTNGLVYQQLIAPLPELPDELLELLPYYTSVLTEVGCGGRDYRETQAWQYAVTGGVGASASIRGAVADEQQASAYLVFSGKALERNHAGLSELLHATVQTPRFDELNRIRELIAQLRGRRERAVTGSGHSLAMQAASSAMSPAAALSHRLRGLAGIRALKALDDSLNAPEAMAAFGERLQRLHGAVQAAPREFLLVGEAEAQARLREELAVFWVQTEQLGEGSFAAFTPPAIRDRVHQAWVTSTQVSFCAKAYPTVPVEHEDAAALTVLGGFLRNGFLHRAVREQGGAYGAGAGQDSDSASFRFFSYRDPRLGETLEDFDRSVQWLLSEAHAPSQLEEAVLGVIGSLDRPRSPAGEAKHAFHSALFGRTSEQRRRFRARILQVSLEDLRRVGETYLNSERASVAVVTSSAALEEAGGLELETERL